MAARAAGRRSSPIGSPELPIAGILLPFPTPLNRFRNKGTCSVVPGECGMPPPATAVLPPLTAAGDSGLAMSLSRCAVETRGFPD